MTDLSRELSDLLNGPCPSLDPEPSASQPLAGGQAAKDGKKKKPGKQAPCTITRPTPDDGSIDPRETPRQPPDAAPMGAREAEIDVGHAPGMLELANTVSTLQSTVLSLLPNTSATTNQQGDDVDDDIEWLVSQQPSTQDRADQGVLGEYSELVEKADEVVGASVSEKLAEVVNKLMSTGLKEDTLKGKLEAFPRPENCKALSAPRVNPEIWSILKSGTRIFDHKLQKTQSLLLKAKSPLARAADGLLDPDKAPSIDPRQTSKLLLDGIAILGAASLDLSSRHRELIKPELDTAFRPLCTDSAGS
ncbi:uncharacterized protein LOC121417731 [Lytechinus variegatus]|uniref:uncharacterized protein LOC121417731 n=1 Tax=Lytechinus variegatus TaxID=7654 RepID=UPI001BB24F37|nr:uncharacterized protein LOC121417731 [Lytechinus variegatus]